MSTKGSDKAPLQPSDVDVPLELTLEDTSKYRRRPDKTPAAPTVEGYNPYDAAPGALPPRPDKEPPKRTDLRKLSEWIRVQKKVEALKGEDAGAEPQRSQDSKPRRP